MHHFVKFLVVCIVLVATCPNTSARTTSLLDAFVKVAQVEEALEEKKIDTINSNSVDYQSDDNAPKISEKKTILLPFLHVELETPSVTIQAGKSRIFTCEVRTNVGANVVWYHDGRVVESEPQIDDLRRISEPLEVPDMGMERIVRLISKYEINCASKKHEGRIHCVAMTGDGIIINSTAINIREGETEIHRCNRNRIVPLITNHYNATVALIGTTVVLPCTTKGKPRPKVKWTHPDGFEITNNNAADYKIFSNGELMIRNLVWEDMGVWECSAVSAWGTDSAGTFIYPAVPS